MVRRNVGKVGTIRTAIIRAAFGAVFAVNFSKRAKNSFPRTNNLVEKNEIKMKGRYTLLNEGIATLGMANNNAKYVKEGKSLVQREK